MQIKEAKNKILCDGAAFIVVKMIGDYQESRMYSTTCIGFNEYLIKTFVDKKPIMKVLLDTPIKLYAVPQYHIDMIEPILELICYGIPADDFDNDLEKTANEHIYFESMPWYDDPTYRALNERDKYDIYLRNKRMHIGVGSRECPLCGIDFNECDLFVCDVCGNLESIENESPYNPGICQDCDEQCRSERALEEHINEKMEELEGKK